MERHYLNDSTFKYLIYIIVLSLQLYFLLHPNLIVFISILLGIILIRNKKILLLFLLLAVICIVVRFNFILKQTVGLFGLFGINLNINTYILQNGFTKFGKKSKKANGQLVIEFRDDDTGNEIENLQKHLKSITNPDERKALNIRINNLILANKIRNENIRIRRVKEIRKKLDKNFYFMFCAPIAVSSIKQMKDIIQLKNKSITEKDTFIFNNEYYKFINKKFKKIDPLKNLSEKFIPHIKENVSCIFIKHNTDNLNAIKLNDALLSVISKAYEYINCYVGVQTRIYKITVKYKEQDKKEIIEFHLKPYMSIEEFF